MRKKVLFIINPFSGNNKHENPEKLIQENLDHNKFDFTCARTESKSHATTLATQAVSEGVDIVVACGGDGTVNEVAKALVGTDTVLGIIPSGSGNGFAMHIGMGRNFVKAIKKLNVAEPKLIDSCYVNDVFFLNLAGIGFDALIAYKADNQEKRGLQMYLKMVRQEMGKFNAEHFTIDTGQEIIEGKFTTIAVANSAMYGYHFTIAPLAELTDGMLDIVCIQEASLFRTVISSWRMLNKSIYKSPLVKTIKSREVTISTTKPYYYHIDGESFSFEGKLHFRIEPLSIKVLFPPEKINMN